MPRGFYKHKLLLDENMRPRTRFPRLNSRFDVKHVAHDFHAGSLSDPQVYALAVKHKRVLITYNAKDFRSFAGTRDDAGIVGVSPHLTVSQVDTKLTAFLLRHSPNTISGKFIDLTGETEI
jgi:hypothetical protein